jgi:hypothetical protein
MGFNVLESIIRGGGAPTTEDYRLNNQWRDQYQPREAWNNRVTGGELVEEAPVWEQMYAKYAPQPPAEPVSTEPEGGWTLLELGGKPTQVPTVDAWKYQPIGNSYSGGALQSGLGMPQVQAPAPLMPEQPQPEQPQPEQPQPQSFNQSLIAYLLSQGVDNQRANYEANRQEGLRRWSDRQEGLRRFNEVYGGRIEPSAPQYPWTVNF